MNFSHYIGVVVLIFPLSLCYPIYGRQETYSGVTDERLSCLAILHVHDETHILGDLGAFSRVCRKGTTRFPSSCLKTFVPPFLPTQLTAHGSPWMTSTRTLILMAL